MANTSPRPSSTCVGIHRDPWHDTGASAVCEVDGERRIICLTEERFNREKDSRGYPLHSLNECLRFLGLDNFGDVEAIASDYIIRESWTEDYNKRLSIVDPNNIDSYNLTILNHHLCHAASAVYTSGFNECAILVVDGRGSARETQTLFHFYDSQFHLIERTTNIGIGLLYAAVTQAIGFKLLQEGKTMGLAPYGSTYFSQNGPILDFKGVFSGISTDYSSICINNSYDLRSIDSKKWSDIQKKIVAYQVQQECERVMLHLASYAKSKTQSSNLCISGGVALNSVANKKILDSSLFENIHINPNCSDTGIPLGAALYAYHNILNKPYTENSTTSAYLGKVYSQDDYNLVLDSLSSRNDIVVTNYSSTSECAAAAARILDKNMIVGVCYGRSEIGPRALGNRSILMSAREANNKDILNSRVKHREAFRPFAPICLEEHAANYFDIKRPCQYMLFVPQVKSNMVESIPAVTHVDGTARLQTISSSEDTITRLILEEYFSITGIPVLINTSFNDNNEPIIESPLDALSCFDRCMLDGLVLGTSLILRNHQGS